MLNNTMPIHKKQLLFIYQQITFKARKYYVYAKVQNKTRLPNLAPFQVFNKIYLIMSNLSHF